MREGESRYGRIKGKREEGEGEGARPGKCSNGMCVRWFCTPALTAYRCREGAGGGSRERFMSERERIHSLILSLSEGVNKCGCV